MNTGNYLENNKVNICGTVVSNIEFSHEVYEEVFYSFMLEVPRLSGAEDKIRITVSEKFLATNPVTLGNQVEIEGQFRSYNNFTGEGNRLILTVFVKNIRILGEDEFFDSENEISLNGYICKQPVYRTTPFGREIADILLAVNRSYNKSDYIPCIAWGRNAKYAQSLSVGDNIIIKGRIQSREYQKRVDETQVENKTAFEVSVSRLEKINFFQEEA